MKDGIVSEAIERLSAAGAVETATITGVTVGDAALLVEVASATDEPGRERDAGAITAGVAHRPEGPIPETSDLAVEEALEWAVSGTGSVERAVGLATLNALSEPYVDWRRGDPMARLEDDVECIVTVGLFAPAFRKFSDVEVRVVERVDRELPETPPGVSVETFTPETAPEAIEGADVVFTTGSAFVYGGVDRYIRLARSATTVLVGATASFLPTPAFEAGVDIVAGAVVSDRRQAGRVIAEGGCGTDLHERGVEKVYAVCGAVEGIAASRSHRFTEP
ncbi:MAG: DUF364 domain-containing protein [Natronomonas sp.]